MIKNYLIVAIAILLSACVKSNSNYVYYDVARTNACEDIIKYAIDHSGNLVSMQVGQINNEITLKTYINEKLKSAKTFNCRRGTTFMSVEINEQLEAILTFFEMGSQNHDSCMAVVKNDQMQFFTLQHPKIKTKANRLKLSYETEALQLSNFESSLSKANWFVTSLENTLHQRYYHKNNPYKLYSFWYDIAEQKERLLSIKLDSATSMNYYPSNSLASRSVVGINDELIIYCPAEFKVHLFKNMVDSGIALDISLHGITAVKGKSKEHSSNEGYSSQQFDPLAGGLFHIEPDRKNRKYYVIVKYPHNVTTTDGKANFAALRRYDEHFKFEEEHELVLPEYINRYPLLEAIGFFIVPNLQTGIPSVAKKWKGHNGKDSIQILPITQFATKKVDRVIIYDSLDSNFDIQVSKKIEQILGGAVDKAKKSKVVYVNRDLAVCPTCLKIIRNALRDESNPTHVILNKPSKEFRFNARFFADTNNIIGNEMQLFYTPLLFKYDSLKGIFKRINEYAISPKQLALYIGVEIDEDCSSYSPDEVSKLLQ
jgi:hypothetical protein